MIDYEYYNSIQSTLRLTYYSKLIKKIKIRFISLPEYVHATTKLDWNALAHDKINLQNQNVHLL
jgi:hypothetical protein